MHSAQQVIKTFAIALAVVIIGAITTSVIAALMVVGETIGLWQNDGFEWTAVENKFDGSNDMDELSVDVKLAKLKIVRGDDFAIESNSEYIDYGQQGSRLMVVEKNHSVFGTSDTEVTIQIPEAMKLKKLDVDAGAGNVYIDSVEAEEVEFDFGAGKAEIRNLTSQYKTKISCGAGMTEISDSWLYSLDLDMGAGKVVIDGRLFGKAEIDAGVGALELNLLGSAEDYYLNINRGIGSVKINGENKSGGAIDYGSGPRLIYIDGGVGSIKVELREEQNGVDEN